MSSIVSFILLMSFL